MEFRHWEGGPDTLIRLNARASFLKLAGLPSENAAAGSGVMRNVTHDTAVDAKPVRTSLRRAVKTVKRSDSIDATGAGDEQPATPTGIGRSKRKASVDERDEMEVGGEDEEGQDEGTGDMGSDAVASKAMSDFTAMPKEGEPLDDPRKPMCIPVGTKVILAQRPAAGKPSYSKVKASVLVGKTVRQ